MVVADARWHRWHHPWLLGRAVALAGDSQRERDRNSDGLGHVGNAGASIALTRETCRSDEPFPGPWRTSRLARKRVLRPSLRPGAYCAAGVCSRPRQLYRCCSRTHPSFSCWRRGASPVAISASTGWLLSDIEASTSRSGCFCPIWKPVCAVTERSFAGSTEK